MMMMKFTIISLVVFILLFKEQWALNTTDYITYIEKLSHDEKFLEEYTKWSLKLFSQPDYLYGNRHEQFSCPIEKPNGNYSIPTSVHALRPSDIKCIGAMGDSLLTSLGTYAITPSGLVMENRGISWSIGGDYTYSKLLSLPNILRKYNAKLKGFSTTIHDQNIISDGLNVAKSGARAIDMVYQVEHLMHRIKNVKLCDWNNDWKVLTFFVGGNDLCSFCEDSNVTRYNPEQYITYIRDALDKLYDTSIPRTFVNLVLGIDIRGVKELTSGGYVCQVLHKKLCPCAAFPTTDQVQILDDYVPRYYQKLVELINTGRYDDREDFTVVIQPFMTKTKLPYKDKHNIDFSYFAPDCFHFSGKGHSHVALSLWNNMFEPVGGKHWSWHMDEPLKCPTKEYPYIFTSKNSAKALDDLKHTTIAETSSQVAVLNITSGIVDNATISKHHKHKKNNSDSWFKRKKSIVITTLLFIIMMLLIVSVVKRRKARAFDSENRRHHLVGVNNTQYPDDDGEVEIWDRSIAKSNYFDQHEPTKTHGTRISFE